jgi:hypothetical protein
MRLLAAFLGNYGCDDIATISHQLASTECQQRLAMRLPTSQGSAPTLTHYRTIGGLSMHQSFRRHHYNPLKIILNGVSIF